MRAVVVVIQPPSIQSQLLRGKRRRGWPGGVLVQHPCMRSCRPFWFGRPRINALGPNVNVNSQTDNCVGPARSTALANRLPLSERNARGIPCVRNVCFQDRPPIRPDVCGIA
jgi:hypothetical protein